MNNGKNETERRQKYAYVYSTTIIVKYITNEDSSFTNNVKLGYIHFIPDYHPDYRRAYFTI